ncbi:hypothetical protein AABB24_000489, partial [Solanum stoloniferum]
QNPKTIFILLLFSLEDQIRRPLPFLAIFWRKPAEETMPSTSLLLSRRDHHEALSTDETPSPSPLRSSLLLSRWQRRAGSNSDQQLRQQPGEPPVDPNRR